MAGNDVLITIRADDKASKPVADMHRNITSSLSGLSKSGTAAFGGLGRSAATFAAGMGIFTVVNSAMSKLAGTFTGAIAESRSLQVAQAQTNAVIASTSGVAGVSAKSVRELAASLEHFTRFDEIAIQSAENLLLTFTNINSGIFEQTTRAVLDMSQALGEDLSSTAIKVGKALQDPVLGVTALRRVGVNFSEAQRDVIKSLVDTGRTAEAQQLILAELKTEFGGSAEAAGKVGLAQRQAKDRFSDMTRELAAGLIPKLELATATFYQFAASIGESKAIREVINAFSGGLSGVREWHEGMSGLAVAANEVGISIRSAIDTIGPHFIEGAQKIGKALADIPWPATVAGVTALGIALTAIIAPWALILAGAVALGIGLIALVGYWDNLERKFPAVAAASDWVRKAFAELSAFVSAEVVPALSSIATAIGATVEFIAENWPTIMLIVGPILDEIVNRIRTAFTIAYHIIAAVMDVIQGDWSGAWEHIKAAGQAALDGIVESISNYAELIVNAIRLIGEGIAALAGEFFDWGWELAKAALDGMLDAIESMGDSVFKKLSPFHSPPGFEELPELYGEFGALLGQNLAQGIADGVEANAAAITSSIERGLAESGRIRQAMESGIVAEGGELRVSPPPKGPPSDIGTSRPIRTLEELGELGIGKASTGGGGGGAAGPKADALAAELQQMIADALGSLPAFSFEGLDVQASAAAFRQAEEAFDALAASTKREMAGLGLSMADLDARGLELTPEFRAMEERMAALRDLASRIDLTRELQLDPFRRAIDSIGDSVGKAAEGMTAAAAALAENMAQNQAEIASFFVNQAARIANAAAQARMPGRIEPGDLPPLGSAAMQDLVASGRVAIGTVGGPQITGGATGISAPVPQFASGGIVRRPTLGLVGEAGPEAIVPLNQWGGGQPITVNVNITGSLIAERQVKDAVVDAVLEAQRLGQL